MSAPHDAAAEAARWLGEAADDLHAANVLHADPGCPRRLVCFLSHLAAEKALKGALVSLGVPIRKTHDLRSLQALLPAKAQSKLENDDLRVLTPWAIVGRYPDEAPDADDRTAEIVLASAARVLAVGREVSAGG